MESKVPGFLYELENAQGGKQSIQFVHSEYNKTYQENVFIKNGTNESEVIKMLIDKVQAENRIREENKQPVDPENEMYEKRLTLALQKVEEREARRKKDAEDTQLSLQQT